MAAEKGWTSLGGQIPVNTSGGLKAKGHPIGATGAAQVVEVVTQLRGEAGPRQVDGARVGLTHTLGGNTATVLVSLFGRE
jgi:acetyl-CoA acetyltransferase